MKLSFSVRKVKC